MDQKNIDLEIRGRDHGVSRTKDGPNQETRKEKTTRELHTKGSRKSGQDQRCAGPAVDFRKFVFDSLSCVS